MREDLAPESSELPGETGDVIDLTENTEAASPPGAIDDEVVDESALADVGLSTVVILDAELHDSGDAMAAPAGGAPEVDHQDVDEQDGPDAPSQHTAQIATADGGESSVEQGVTPTVEDPGEAAALDDLPETPSPPPSSIDERAWDDATTAVPPILSTQERIRPLVRKVILRLSLSRRIGADASPAGWIVMAWAWSMGAVLACCVMTAIAIGAVTRSGLPDVRVFVDCWRVAHLMPIQTTEGPVSFVPMLPAFVVVAVMLRSNRWLWTRMRARPEGAERAGFACSGLTAGYVVVAALIATSPTRDFASDGPMTQGLATLAGLVVLPGLLVWSHQVIRLARPRFWRLLRASAAVFAVLFALSLLALVVQLVLAWGEYWAAVDGLLSDAEQPATWIDVAALGLLQLSYAPNALVWAAAYLVGAGFSVGEGTIVSPFSVQLGTVPEFPLATLIPTEPQPWPLLPPILVALGSFVAGAVMRVGASPRQTALRSAAAVAIAVLCCAGMTLLAGASSGGLGLGRLSVLGPDPVMTGLATLVVIGAGQAVWALLPTFAADVRPLVKHVGRRLRRGRGRGAGRPGRTRRASSMEG